MAAAVAASPMITTFNGGKMTHALKTTATDGHKEKLNKDDNENKEDKVDDMDPDDALKYVDDWYSDTGREALVSPDARMYVKINGSCGMLVRDPQTNEWVIYQRYDDKKNKFDDGKAMPVDHISVPGGANPLQYQYYHGRVKHKYYMRRLDRNAKGKSEHRINTLLYQIVDRAVASGRLTPEDNYVSIELCGRNFNQTPGVDEIGIALHREQLLKEPLVPPPENTVEAWKATLVQYVTKYPCEGIVLRHPSGLYFKVLSRMLGVDHKDQYLAPVLLWKI